MTETADLHWTTQQRQVRALVPLSYNPRILDEDGRARLLRSLKKFNLAEIPAINLDDTIIAGHQRCAMLIDLGRGEEWIDVRVPNRQLTKEELDEYNVTSNVGAGQWDYQALLDNFAHINLSAVMTTVDTERLAELSALAMPVLPADEEDVDPEPPEVPISAEGDLYVFRSGATGLEHRLLCGDTTDMDQMARLMNGELADMVDTDPPYNVNYTGKTKRALTIKNDKMKGGDFYAFLYDVYTSFFAFMKPGAPIFVFHADSEGANFRQALTDAGLKLSQCLVWVKQSFVMGRQDFHWQHEPILYGWKLGEAHKYYGDRKQSTVIRFDRPSRNNEHPTMKPPPVHDYFLGTSSLAGDIILDGFGGSGSLLISCEGQGRRYRGMELDPRYADVHVRRWVKFMRDNRRAYSVTRNGVDLTETELDGYLANVAAA